MKKSKSTAKTQGPKKARSRSNVKSTQNMVVFAFRLMPSERKLIHRAAGPGKASRFVKKISLAAARGDMALIRKVLKEAGIN